MCFTLRLHMSAAPTQGGLTQALGHLDMSLSIKDAQEIVDQYATALTRSIPDNGIARYMSWLPCTPEKIIQSFKILVAFEIQQQAMPKDLKNQFGSALSALPSFISDTKAQQINKFRNKSSSERFELRNTQTYQDLDDFSTESGLQGFIIHSDFEDFLSMVEGFDLGDPLYFQRAYTLAGVEYVPPRKRRFWQLF
jgi:hypothetical protein